MTFLNNCKKFFLCTLTVPLFLVRTACMLIAYAADNLMNLIIEAM
jgi:hypothetical protein